MFFLIVGLLLSISSCSEDNDGYAPRISSNSILGSWLCSNSKGNKVAWKEYTFNQDGSYSFETVSVPGFASYYDLKRKGNGIYQFEGDYLNRGDSVSTGIDWSGQEAIDFSTNSFMLMHRSKNTTEKFNRIVDTYTMRKGETRLLGQGMVSALSYSSSADFIASVDNKGLISANRYGTTYVTAHYPNEDVVVKVMVEDGDNTFPDFIDFLRVSRDSVISYFGNQYFDLQKAIETDPDTYAGMDPKTLLYLAGTNQIKRIEFDFNHIEFTRKINLELWSSDNAKDVLETIKKHYTYRKTVDGFDYYWKNIGEYEYYCAIDTTLNIVSYENLLNSFEYLDGLAYYDNLEEVLNDLKESILFDYMITSNDETLYYKAKIKNSPYFDCIKIQGEKNKKGEIVVKQIYLDCFSDMTKDKLFEMAKQFYKLLKGTDASGKPVTNLYQRKDWWNMKPIVKLNVVRYENGTFGYKYTKTY